MASPSKRAIVPEVRVIMAPRYLSRFLPLMKQPHSQISHILKRSSRRHRFHSSLAALPFLLLYRSDEFRTFTTNNPPAFSPKYFLKNTILISFRARKTFLHLFSQQIQICFWRICESEREKKNQTAGYLLSNMRFLVLLGKRCGNHKGVITHLWSEVLFGMRATGFKHSGCGGLV